MNNLRFATITHILTLLAAMPNQWLSSEWIASSININAVIVRKELSFLRKHGFIQSKKGKEGGVILAIKPEDISLSQIFKLLTEDGNILYKKNSPNPECIVGKQINEKLDGIYDELQSEILKYLEQHSIESFYQSFKK